VKRVLFSILAAIVVSLASSYVLFGAADTNSTSGTETGTVTKPAKPVSRRALKADLTTSKKVAADVNAADPNAAKLKTFEDLDKALDDIVKENEEKRVERTQRSVENRVENIKLFYKHVATEFNLIRKIAVEEKAEKTVEAIDRILESREKRLETRLAEIQDEKRAERQRMREERIEKERERRQKIEERLRDRDSGRSSPRDY
jgi:hypothetical protein